MRHWQVIFELENRGAVVIDYIEADTENEALTILESRMEEYKKRLEKIDSYYVIRKYYVLEDKDLSTLDF